MNNISIPPNYNYIGVFLTFACQLRCPYCINHEKGAKPTYAILTGAEWAQALNRIETRPDLPITLQGGEPTLHPQFYDIVKGIRKDTNIDLLTNCQFDIDEFCRYLPLSRLRRNAPYASIRVSYHPSTMDIEDTISRVSILKERGYSIGVWIVNCPEDSFIEHYRQQFLNAGIDCRLKEYLDGKTHGTYKYMGIQGMKDMLCKPSELLIAPNGDIHRCHGDLYNNKKAYANVLDNNITFMSNFARCEKVACTSCDIKVKFDRFQVKGHCAVTIRRPPTLTKKENNT